MAQRTLSGSVTHLVVVKAFKLDGVDQAPGDELVAADIPKGTKVDQLISRGYLKVPGQLPLRSNKDIRPFHVAPGDYPHMTGSGA